MSVKILEVELGLFKNVLTLPCRLPRGGCGGAPCRPDLWNWPPWCRGPVRLQRPPQDSASRGFRVGSAQLAFL